jgi:hypothetical protein
MTDLYAIAKRITLTAGFDWTDPRTRKTYRARKKTPRKAKRKKRR